MKINDAGFIDWTVESVNIVSEHHPVVSDDIGCSTHRSGCEVAMLGHFITSSGYDKASCSRNVERVFTVTSRTHHINIAVAVEPYRHPGSQNTISEAQQFIHRHSTHLQSGEQGSDLLFGKLAPGDAHDDIAGLLTSEFFVIEQSVQYFFHCHSCNLLFSIFTKKYEACRKNGRPRSMGMYLYTGSLLTTYRNLELRHHHAKDTNVIIFMSLIYSDANIRFFF